MSFFGFLWVVRRCTVRMVVGITLLNHNSFRWFYFCLVVSLAFLPRETMRR